MNLHKLDLNQKEKYQSFVKSNGCFLQDWNWGDFQFQQGKKVLRFAVEENDEYILTAQVFKNELKGKNYFYAPYGPVTKNTEALSFFLAEMAKENPKAIFVRIEPQDISKEFFSKKGFKKSLDLNPHKTLVLDLSKSLDDLQKEMHPKTRYNIRVAAKHSVKVLRLDKFTTDAAKIFSETAKRAGVRFQSAEYFSSILDFFGKTGDDSKSQNLSACLYQAEVDGQINAANLMIFWNGTATYLFGGSSDFKRNSMSPYALHWQAIQDAKDSGCDFYDFWGVEQDPNHPWYGFSRFKLGFGGEVLEYSGTFDYLINPAWYNVYNVVRKLNRIVRR